MAEASGCPPKAILSFFHRSGITARPWLSSLAVRSEQLTWLLAVELSGAMWTTSRPGVAVEVSPPHSFTFLLAGTCVCINSAYDDSIRRQGCIMEGEVPTSCTKHLDREVKFFLSQVTVLLYPGYSSFP